VYTGVFTSLLGTDGDCSYKLFINEKEMVDIQNPRIYETDLKEYASYEIKFDKVQSDRRSSIRVELGICRWVLAV